MTFEVFLEFAIEIPIRSVSIAGTLVGWVRGVLAMVGEAA